VQHSLNCMLEFISKVGKLNQTGKNIVGGKKCAYNPAILYSMEKRDLIREGYLPTALVDLELGPWTSGKR